MTINARGRRVAWRRAAVPAACLALLAFSSATGAQEESTLARCMREAGAAYEAGDFEGHLRGARCALAELPGHPRLIYNVACGQSLTGDARGAIESLGRLVAMGLVYNLAAESDFDPIRQRRGFRRVQRRMDRFGEPHGEARRWLKLDAPQIAGGRFVPEGVAYDPERGELYLSSVHRRRIVRIPADGEPSVLAAAADGLGAVFGMAVDAERRHLWACTADIEHMEGFDPDGEARGELLRFDLDAEESSGSSVSGRFALPAGEANTTCNDLAVGASGEVFVADSRGGAVYRLAAAGDRLEPLVPIGGGLRSPNGLVVSADNRRLYVADYPAGLFAVDLASGEVEKLASPPDAMLRGIDGLARKGDSLLAIQNGYAPHRVLRLQLTPDGRGVRRLETLLANHPDFDEPTLGTVVDDRLLLVANSHWNRFAPDHSLPPAEELTPPILLAIELD